MFRKIFGQNDWYPVWVHVSKWTITSYHYPYFDASKREESCSYEVLYSPTRQKYKLKLSGLDPKGHKDYKKAVDKLNQFINNHNEKLNFPANYGGI